MGVRLFAELAELRDLNEKRELEKVKHALEVQVQQKDLLLKEINHRVKNSLQIVSSILQLQVPDAQSPEAADALAGPMGVRMASRAVSNASMCRPTWLSPWR
jgi:light-regulated signal transduction histidine kinase (bacteriophytochrome)